MDFNMVLARARRGLRDDVRLYLVAVSSLTVAFLCLGASLFAIENLDVLADQWGRTRRMTVYLDDGAATGNVTELRTLLAGLPEVATVEHVSAAAARAEFVEQSDVGGALGELPADAFPASLEIVFRGEISVARMGQIAERIQRFGVVEDVETYEGWFGRLESLLIAGRGAAAALAILVLVCVVAVVGNTIRLAVAGRRAEIEVMKLCGATDGFVRGPFVLEGAFQAFLAASLAIAFLLAAWLGLRGEIDASVAALAGVRTVFLDPAWMVAMIVGATLFGALGSAASLRRYLVV